jgi:rhomboid family GlyGly-CTERM serine protease
MVYMPLKINSHPQRYVKLVRQHLFPIGLIVLVLQCQLGGLEVLQILHYDRISIMSGQIWRIFSGHFVHLGWRHFSLNITAFVAIWCLFGNEWQQRVWLLMFAFIAVATSLALLIFQPGLEWSVGLSGVLHGLFAAGLIGSLYRGLRYAPIILIVFIAKLVLEQTSPMPGSEEWIGGSVITIAHLYGAVAGSLIALFLLVLNKNTRCSEIQQ